MLLQIDENKFWVDFNDGISVKPLGKENYFYFELTEYTKNNHSPKIVEAYHVHTNPPEQAPQSFYLPIQFYFDFELSIYKFVKNYGIKLIYTHRFNDNNKVVKFIVNPKDSYEGYKWIEKINLYCSIHNCKKIIESTIPELENFSDFKYSNREIEPYKTYRIGRFPKNSTDFRTTDVRMEGYIWYSNWKTFWSYEHPRSWNFLSSEEIVTDILGL